MSDDDIREKIIYVLETGFAHLPYVYVQDALGMETSYEFANKFDKQPSGAYEGRFGNAVGGRILADIVDEVGIDVLLERHRDLTPNDTLEMEKIDPSSDAAIATMAEFATHDIFKRIGSVFPEVDASLLKMRHGKDLSAYIEQYAMYERWWLVAEPPTI